MRNITRLLVAALFCAALFSVEFVGAQDTTETPTAPPEATTEATVEATVETTSEATVEATVETTAEATSAATAAPSATATAVPTLTATTQPTTAGQTNTSGLVVCDSSLILDLYIAEHYFGFDGVMTAAMSTSNNVMTTVDLTTLDKGQYEPLFSAPMTVPASTVMTQDQMQTAGGLMAMDDSTFRQQMMSMMPAGTDMSSLTTLNSSAVAGENPACATLRSELNRFYTIVAFQGMQADMMAATATASSSGTSSAVNFSTTMTGANETQPADPDGTGTAAITIDMANAQVCYIVTVQNIALPATAAHIHRGAVGVKGAPVVTFDVLPDASGTATSCVKTDAALLQEIASNPAGFYVNVHNAEFPDGAVRGQLSG